MKTFRPPQEKSTILNYFKGNFSTPLKRSVNFFHPTEAGLQKILTPLTCRPTPYCWVKNDQPLKAIEAVLTIMLVTYTLVLFHCAQVI